MHQDQKTCCDLLEKSYLCGINNNETKLKGIPFML